MSLKSVPNGNAEQAGVEFQQQCIGDQSDDDGADIPPDRPSCLRGPRAVAVLRPHCVDGIKAEAAEQQQAGEFQSSIDGALLMPATINPKPATETSE